MVLNLPLLLQTIITQKSYKELHNFTSILESKSTVESAFVYLVIYFRLLSIILSVCMETSCTYLVAICKALRFNAHKKDLDLSPGLNSGGIICISEDTFM